MKKTVALSLIILINIFFINQSFGQGTLKYKTYHQNNFEKNKIFGETFHFWSYKNRWFPSANDTLPYFVDDRDYKGITNYGVTFRSKNFKTFQFVENFSMCFLKVEFINCDFNPKDSIINIEGFVSGGWNEPVKKGNLQNHINIYLGEKTDTISSRYFEEMRSINKELIEAKLNNVEVDEFAVLDKFPSFYFKKYSYYRTSPTGRRLFKISGKVNTKSLLAFGSRGCYTEIFDIGSMIFSPNKNIREKNLKNQNIDCKPIITNNNRVSYNEKEQPIKEDISYYLYTKNAENYILSRQYAKAIEQYNLLNQKYPTLFARDIHNAIRCAILSRDLNTTFLWSEKLALKGVPLPYFNAKIFTKLRANQSWKSFCTKYDSLLNVTKSQWDLNLKQEMQNLLNEDQSNYGIANRKNSQTLYQTTEKITKNFVSILELKGFPSEEKIGVPTQNDTILVQSPDYNVIIRHAVQQKPKELPKLLELLSKYEKQLTYDMGRSNNHKNFPNACFHIYKGNLYKVKSCKENSIIINKIKFKFNNPNNFIVDFGDYIISEYNPENPKEWDDYYSNNFNFITKLTDDWKFYEK